MPIPRVIARMNRVGLNRLTRRIAPRAPGFGLVVHRGRNSGREYRTPVNVFPIPGGYRMALTYGADSDWVKNVLAAQGCWLITGGEYVQLTAPRLVHDSARTHLPTGPRQMLGLIGVDDFLDLEVVLTSGTRPV
jgi:deazaflavin-dependent oxidoreductase (nitroreductase family)